MQGRIYRRALPLPGRSTRAAAVILSVILAVTGSPAIAQPAETPLAYDVLPVGPGGAPVFVGTAEPGATIDLLDGATVLATGVANDRGEWILAAPGPARNVAALTVRITSPGGRFQTLPTPRANANGSPAAALPLTATLAEGRIEGAAAPAAAILIEGGPEPLAATADAGGRWVVPLPQLPAGAYAFRAAAEDAEVLLELVVPLDPAAIEVAVAFALPAITAATGTLAGPRFIVVGPRDTLWDIAVRAYGDGLRYRDIFAANRDQLRDPRRILAGQVLLIP